MTMIPQNTLIVVADGGGARLFRNTAASGAASLVLEKELSPGNLDDDGPSGSRPAEQTPQQTDEATFAKQLAQALYGMKSTNAFSDLVLVADPQTLGQIRGALHKTVDASIVLSLNKDLTNHAMADIEKALH